MPKKEASQSGARPIGTIRVLDVNRLQEDSANVRPKKDEDIGSLAKSIETVGLLHAPIVRPDPEDKNSYIIVAGCRRLRAIRRLKWEKVSCIVIAGEKDDPHPDVVRVVENHQRKDLSPLEEAAAVRALLDQDLELATVARSLGRSKSWVARRASLTDLTESWIQAVQDASSVISQWPPSHLELVSRFPEPTRERMYQYWTESWHYERPPALRDLEQVCAQFQELLAAAPWSLEDETLLPEAGACMTCPMRSSQAQELFPEELPVGEGKSVKGDRCLDSECWDRKRLAYLARRVEDVSEKHPEVVLLNNGEYGDVQHLREQFPARSVVNAWSIVRCKKSDPHAHVALVAAGPGLGRLQYVKPDREEIPPSDSNGSVHPSTHELTDGLPYSEETSEDALARKQEAYDRRRRQQVIDAVHRKLMELSAAGTLESAKECEGGEALVQKGMLLKTLYLLTRLLSEQGWLTGIQQKPACAPVEWDATFAHVNHSIGKDEPREAAIDMCWQLMRMGLRIWARRLHDHTRENLLHYREAEELCWMLCLDLGALRAEAAGTIPYAKAWGAEVEDAWQAEREENPQEDTEEVFSEPEECA